MSSKSFRNIISILALSNGIALVIKQATQAKTPVRLADALDMECSQAMNLWPESMDSKEIKRIYVRLAAFESETIPERGRPELLTSIALGLIEDVSECIKDPLKRTALERVGQKLMTVHGYYDRHGDRFEVYQQANRAIDFWHRQEG